MSFETLAPALHADLPPHEKVLLIRLADGAADNIVNIDMSKEIGVAWKEATAEEISAALQSLASAGILIEEDQLDFPEWEGCSRYEINPERIPQIRA